MGFNPDKCQVLHITRARNPIKSTIHNKTGESVSSARYLGVALSTNLSFNTHINRLTSNENKFLVSSNAMSKQNIKVSGGCI